METPILFVEKNSTYQALSSNIFDIDRNAYTYASNRAVVCHPPCRLWSRMRAFSTAPACEKLTAIWSVNLIRQVGGVLEHPVGSSLWRFMQLPLPGSIDNFGGFSICINQKWFGHPCEKATMLYICGCEPGEIPAHPLNFDALEFWISANKRSPFAKPEVSRAWRNKTPLEFGKYLIEIAEIINNKKNKT